MAYIVLSGTLNLTVPWYIFATSNSNILFEWMVKTFNDKIMKYETGTRMLAGPPREFDAPADGSLNWGGQALYRP